MTVHAARRATLCKRRHDRERSDRCADHPDGGHHRDPDDFTQYGATHYFRDREADASLAASLCYASQLAAEARESTDGQVRLAGALIDTATIVQAYATDHGHKT